MSARRDDSPLVVLVVMGPAGSGKTTSGRLFAERRSARFVDADDHHDARSIEKMQRGEALDDDDRAPWLARLRDLIDRALGDGAAGPLALVVACSALRARYREALGVERPGIGLVHLRVPADELERRLALRTSHFAGTSLLASQLATLEEPDETFVLDGSLDEAAIQLALDERFPRR